MEPQGNPSYQLGQVLELLQVMEETLPQSKPKGKEWADQLLPLFQANLESTLQMVLKACSTLPPKVTVSDGRECTLSQVETLVKSIDFAKIQGGNINDEDYLSGYHGDPAPPQSWTTASHSFTLGVFMGQLHCMEQASSTSSDSATPAEDAYLMLNLNFSTTLQMIMKTIGTLPKTTQYHGKEITLEELKVAYDALDMDILTQSSLSKEEFEQGFQTVLDRYPAP